MFVICATLVHGTLGSATSPIAAEPDWEKQRLRWKRLAGRGWEGASALWRGFAVDMNDWAAARFGVLLVDWLMSVVKGARQRVLSTTRSGSHFFSFSWSSLIKRR